MLEFELTGLIVNATVDDYASCPLDLALKLKSINLVDP
jgi:hypothetical protein